MNYQVPLPENQGETLIYSTDAEGVVKGKMLLSADGIFTFNDGDKQAARNGDEVKTTITEDPSFWGWATKYNVFNTAWIGALATLQSSGGTPTGVVAYATAMQTLLTSLGQIPSELTSKITEGTSEVLFP